MVACCAGVHVGARLGQLSNRFLDADHVCDAGALPGNAASLVGIDRSPLVKLCDHSVALPFMHVHRVLQDFGQGLEGGPARLRHVLPHVDDHDSLVAQRLTQEMRVAGLPRDCRQVCVKARKHLIGDTCCVFCGVRDDLHALVSQEEAAVVGAHVGHYRVPDRPGQRGLRRALCCKFPGCVRLICRGRFAIGVLHRGWRSVEHCKHL